MSIAIEQKARRAAKRAGFYATKSRWRVGTIDNHGGFMLIEPHSNFAVGGLRFDMTPKEVIEYCAD